MDPWPLRHLVLRTPRLELRPDDDAGLLEMVEVALSGVHPPEQMPFSMPWTEMSPAELGRGSVRNRWRKRAEHSPENWDVGFLVRHQGRVIGTQGLMAENFAVLREVTCGSWFGMAHQGQGFGTEAWAAVLLLAFDHLGAELGHALAFADNTASRAVSRKLGYQDTGTRRVVRRGEPAVQAEQRVTPGGFKRPDWTLEVDGLDACREMLGA
ncbi:GNAT family N-acetyltransferase [Crossiella sp. NPDC003009]